MAAADSALIARLQRQGYGAVQPSAGLAALHAALTGQLPFSQLMISPFDWQPFLQGKLLTRGHPASALYRYAARITTVRILGANQGARLDYCLARQGGEATKAFLKRWSQGGTLPSCRLQLKRWIMETTS